MRQVINSYTGEYEFLRNFAWSTVTIEVVRGDQRWRDSFNCVEKAYQAAKALDYGYFRRIYMNPDMKPWEAKKLGRRIEAIPDLDARKEEIMLACLRSKFTSEAFGRKLLDTNDAILIEGNLHHDNYWGECYCFKTPNPKYGVKHDCVHGGRNRLGTLQMQVRTELATGMFIPVVRSNECVVSIR